MHCHVTEGIWHDYTRAHLTPVVLDNHLMGAAFIQSDKVDTVSGTKALLPAA